MDLSEIKTLDVKQYKRERAMQGFNSLAEQVIAILGEVVIAIGLVIGFFGSVWVLYFIFG